MEGIQRMRTCRAGALVGLLLMLPFALLEGWHTKGAGSLVDFPFPLFGLMWALGMTAAVAVAPIVRTVRARTPVFAPLQSVLRLACALAAGLLWAGIVQDQMPCFMGVPNCD